MKIEIILNAAFVLIAAAEIARNGPTVHDSDTSAKVTPYPTCDSQLLLGAIFGFANILMKKVFPKIKGIAKLNKAIPTIIVIVGRNR